ncbi:hypothetical protein CAEBREN_10927 [Caenorhabditis brenneri]|uniref:Uncharacterized protein n=1 Tax=Caenorhabditis brenneri TaxID=135651 RepID=G0NKF6_CAEBE|nr:hypothetical protein CAEBREN_10927 [Caenorhabditis brenneri]
MGDRAPPPNNHPPAHPRDNRPPRYNPLARPEGIPARGQPGQAPANLDHENPRMPEQNQERPGESYYERLIRTVNEAIRTHRMLEQNRADPAIVEEARDAVREGIARYRIVVQNLRRWRDESLGPEHLDAQELRGADPQDNKENEDLGDGRHQ